MTSAHTKCAEQQEEAHCKVAGSSKEIQKKKRHRASERASTVKFVVGNISRVEIKHRLFACSRLVWFSWTHRKFELHIQFFIICLAYRWQYCSYIHKEIANKHINACSNWALSNSALGVAARHRHTRTRTRSYTVLDDFCTWLGCVSDRVGFRLSLYLFCPLTYLNFRTIFKTLLLIKALFSMRKFNKRVASCRFCNRYWWWHKRIDVSISDQVTNPSELQSFCVNANGLKNAIKLVNKNTWNISNLDSWPEPNRI